MRLARWCATPPCRRWSFRAVRSQWPASTHHRPTSHRAPAASRVATFHRLGREFAVAQIGCESFQLPAFAVVARQVSGASKDFCDALRTESLPEKCDVLSVGKQLVVFVSPFGHRIEQAAKNRAN